MSKAVEQDKGNLRKIARRFAAVFDGTNSILDYIARLRKFVIRDKKFVGRRESFQNRHRTSALDGTEAKLKPLRKASGHALPVWMRGAEQLFGDAENQLAVGR